MARLLQQCIPCRPEDRALVLQDSVELEKVYTAAALQGDTAPPDNAEDEVDFHYICFARSKSGKLYELDGDKWGPVDLGVVLAEDEDLLSERVLDVIRVRIAKTEHGESFALMALADNINIS